ncbi:hypothetical protein DICPUDRAFT_77799 [Dictyostelium purpureum]|uniref:C2H2-type domain-containing protein n=1 Tax=Dictyostelium purpureum TaxID=5786 RepID=F0ZHN5_DICPU|nr:uncharacterized protein DICPUDRAFT_77799 [Dictyostelium purpureum]EGC36563.1 hypothetical protein DICPUDRAFT_77799 [Dictyostelium purpureum]|eukprot:XP_003286935.1 hypothetical protein DICPUDRAFT_77799 [Dictyostelium purpureum]
MSFYVDSYKLFLIFCNCLYLKPEDESIEDYKRYRYKFTLECLQKYFPTAELNPEFDTPSPAITVKSAKAYIKTSPNNTQLGPRPLSEEFIDDIIQILAESAPKTKRNLLPCRFPDCSVSISNKSNLKRHLALHFKEILPQTMIFLCSKNHHDNSNNSDSDNSD